MPTKPIDLAVLAGSRQSTRPLMNSAVASSRAAKGRGERWSYGTAPGSASTGWRGRCGCPAPEAGIRKCRTCDALPELDASAFVETLAAGLESVDRELSAAPKKITEQPMTPRQRRGGCRGFAACGGPRWASRTNERRLFDLLCHQLRRKSSHQLAYDHSSN